MAGDQQVKALSALVKVTVSSAAGEPVWRQVGFTPEGKPALEQATKLRLLQRGATLPDNLAPGELERLEAQGAVGTPAEVAAVTARTAVADQGGIDTQPPAPAEGAAVVANVAAMSDAELAAWIETTKPTVDETVVAAADDPALASRLLAAEETATGGDPRKGVQDGLGRIIGGGE